MILIKSPEPVAQRGINRGDREVTGELDVIEIIIGDELKAFLNTLLG